MLDTYIKIFADQKNLVSLIQYKKISLNPFSYFFFNNFFYMIPGHIAIFCWTEYHGSGTSET